MDHICWVLLDIINIHTHIYIYIYIWATIFNAKMSDWSTFLQNTNIIYQFSCSLGNCFSPENENPFVGHTTIFSCRITYDQSAIHQHPKRSKYS